MLMWENVSGRGSGQFGVTMNRYLIKDDSSSGYKLNPECTEPDKRYWWDDYNGGRYTLLPKVPGLKGWLDLALSRPSCRFGPAVQGNQLRFRIHLRHSRVSEGVRQGIEKRYPGYFRPVLLSRILSRTAAGPGRRCRRVPCSSPPLHGPGSCTAVCPRRPCRLVPCSSPPLHGPGARTAVCSGRPCRLCRCPSPPLYNGLFIR